MKQEKEYLSKETLLRAIEVSQKCYTNHESELTPLLVKMAVTALETIKEFVNMTPAEYVQEVDA